MTTVFGHGALRLYLLSLLAEAPRHGYELIQALEERFGGTYTPSAGTIYPRLSKLEDEGLLTKHVEGRRATYTITDAGRAELAAREGELASLETEITDSVRRMADDVREGVRSAMQALRADLAAAERTARSAPPPPMPSAAEASGTSGGDAHAASRAASRMAIHDVDLALADFREGVRSAVRAERGARVTTATAAGIRSELEQALVRIHTLIGP